MYHEDVDLSLRLRLAGGRLGIEPAAVVDHDYEFAKGAAKWRLLERNRWATIVRCYPGAAAGRCSRRRCWRPSSRCWWSPRPAAGCRRSSRATGETLRALPRLLRERRAIQATRTISSARVRRLADARPRLAVPRRARRRARAAALGAAAYWRVVTAPRWRR